MRSPRPLSLLFLSSFLLVLSLVRQASALGVVAIDYGTEWMKISLIKPGLPFDVVLSSDSKRKTQSVVGFKGEERVFGSDAFSLASRFPENVYPAAKLVAGRLANDSFTERQARLFGTRQVPTERGTVSVRRTDGESFLVEELIAMQFQHAKALAEDTAGERLWDAIVTVPPFFTQYERQAMWDAIELAGFRPMALVNDGVATAVNFAMTRDFPTSERHVFFDVGAGATKATVVEFSSLVDQERNGAAYTQVDVKGVGWDRELGGIALDEKVRDILAEDFQNKHGSKLSVPVKENKRAMARLLKEANRVKQVLSANQEATSGVESLADDIDFRTKVSRAQLEDACADLKPHFTQPLLDALEAANLTESDINSVVLVGGSSRVPMIQSAVRSLVGPSRIAQNINADEAAVMGAALYGASVAPGFRTKDIRVDDINTYDIEAVHDPESERPTEVRVFSAGSPAGIEKGMTVPKKQSFQFALGYPEDGNRDPAFPKQFMLASVSGVEAALQNFTSEAGEPPSSAIYMVIESDVSGIVKPVEANLMIKPPGTGSIADKLRVLLGQAPPGEANQTEPAEGEQTVKLKVDKTYLGVKPMSLNEKKASRSMLLTLEGREKLKAQREAARNGLESYIYRVRDMLESDPAFIESSKEAERKAIQDKLSELSAWLSEEGDSAETDELKLRKSSLESVVNPVHGRSEEHTLRPELIAALEKAFVAVRKFVDEALTNVTLAVEAGETPKYTEEELVGLTNMLATDRKWLTEQTAKQLELGPADEPALKSGELKRKTEILEGLVDQLRKRKAPKVPKAPKASSSSSASASAPTHAAKESGKEAGKKEDKVPVHEDL